MSMSQEEIEALMNGLDIPDDEPAENSSSDDTVVNTDEIEELIAQTSESSNDEDVSVETENIQVEENIPEEPSPIDENETVSTDDIDDLLKNLEGEATEEDTSVEEEPKAESDFNDELADIDGIVEPTSEAVETPIIDDIPEIKEEAIDPIENSDNAENNIDKEEIVKDWTDSKISEGIIPLPADQDTKVVNQLSQVANDSEEKVGQIFDVLSLGLDNNNELRTQISNLEKFIEEENKLINTLAAKFPNIEIFKEHSNKLNDVNINLTSINNLLNEEDMKIFEAMELMQFNDINRQKIERVMSVIRKLSMYLNNLFEDDGSSAEVAVAKHIHGDQTNDLVGDELDSLIAEFENNK